MAGAMTRTFDKVRSMLDEGEGVIGWRRGEDEGRRMGKEDDGAGGGALWVRRGGVACSQATRSRKPIIKP